MNFGAPGQLIEPNYEWSVGPDMLNKGKCDYWQSAPYFPEPGSSEVKFNVQDGGDKAELKRM